jgi:hypothetical protein
MMRHNLYTVRARNSRPSSQEKDKMAWQPVEIRPKETVCKAAPAGDGARIEIGPGRHAPEKTVTRAAVREMIFRKSRTYRQHEGEIS